MILSPIKQFNRKQLSLTDLIFMALCCDMGIFLKKLIAPCTNIITEALHIPGGIGTSFSIMFVLIGAVLCPYPGSATLMSFVQSMIALAVGTTGSMGVLAPIGYVVPGMVIDLALMFSRGVKLKRSEQLVLANALAGMAAALCANLIVFRLSGPVLWLYVSVACTSGVISGILGGEVIKHVEPVVKRGRARERRQGNEVK